MTTRMPRVTQLVRPDGKATPAYVHMLGTMEQTSSDAEAAKEGVAQNSERIDVNEEAIQANADAIGALQGQITPNAVLGLGAGFKMAWGFHITASAADVVPTGLDSVVSMAMSPAVAPSAGASWFSGDLTGTPGAIVLQTWDGNGNPGSNFGKKLFWLAIGT